MSDTSYKISVMQAFVDGEPIEIYDRIDDAWRFCCAPNWNWGTSDYRIAEKPSCSVGEQQRRERIMEAFKGGEPIEGYDSDSGTWDRIRNPNWNWGKNDYRIAPQATACAFVFENGGIGWAVEGSANYDQMAGNRALKRIKALDLTFDWEE